MKTLAFSLLLLAGAASAQEDKRAEFLAALDSGRYPALSYFVNNIGGGRDGAQAAEFARYLPDSATARRNMYQGMEMLVRGGKLDKNGVNIRRELGKLPGAQWHFVLNLERERRALYDRLGWGPGGNILQNSGGLVGIKVEPRLCSDRSSKLAAAMAPLEKDRLFRAWSTEEITANMITVRDSRGLRDELYGGVHWAPCFRYDDGRVRVELVADAWANALVPAYTWWYDFDRDTHDYLYRSGGRDWCGEAILEKAVQAQIAARRAAEKKTSAPSSPTMNKLSGSPF